MERERLTTAAEHNQGQLPDDFDSLDQVRQRLDAVNEAADRLLAAYTPIQAEQFLERNRQMSAQ